MMPFTEYKNAVGFTSIAVEICNKRCEKARVRDRIGCGVQINLLKKAAVYYTRDNAPVFHYVPQKKDKMVIVGTGISGLACALRLCEKKY